MLVSGSAKRCDAMGSHTVVARFLIASTHAAIGELRRLVNSMSNLSSNVIHTAMTTDQAHTLKHTRQFTSRYCSCSFLSHLHVVYLGVVVRASPPSLLLLFLVDCLRLLHCCHREKPEVEPSCLPAGVT